MIHSFFSNMNMNMIMPGGRHLKPDAMFIECLIAAFCSKIEDGSLLEKTMNVWAGLILAEHRNVNCQSIECPRSLLSWLL